MENIGQKMILTTKGATVRRVVRCEWQSVGRSGARVPLYFACIGPSRVQVERMKHGAGWRVVNHRRLLAMSILEGQNKGDDCVARGI